MVVAVEVFHNLLLLSIYKSFMFLLNCTYLKFLTIQLNIRQGNPKGIALPFLFLEKLDILLNWGLW